MFRYTGKGSECDKNRERQVDGQTDTRRKARTESEVVREREIKRERER